jgi:hypothetical protein
LTVQIYDNFRAVERATFREIEDKMDALSLFGLFAVTAMLVCCTGGSQPLVYPRLRAALRPMRCRVDQR